MDNRLYDAICREMPMAFSYHRLIANEKGEPYDYEFLAVNPTFEKIVSLQSEEVLGRRATDIFPSLKADSFDWIGCFAQVVRTKKSRLVEQYFRPLSKWLQVFVFSPEPDCFVTLFYDSTPAVWEREDQNALMCGLDDVILELDENYTIVKVMAPESVVLPVPKDKLIGTNTADIYPEEDHGLFFHVLEAARTSGRKETYLQHTYRFGEERWYRIDAKYMLIRGRARYIISISNATENTRLQRQLEDSEALFKAVFDQAPVGISVGHTDEPVHSEQDGRPTVNRKYQEIMGRTKKELDASDWSDFTYPDDLKTELPLFERFRSGQIRGYTLEKRFFRPDQSVIHTRMILSALRAGDLRNVDYLCILEDITERKQLEESLRESERSKSVLLSHLPGLAYRCQNDLRRTMEFVSEGCLALTGYNPESFIGNRDLAFCDIISPEAIGTVRNALDQAVALQTSYRQEYPIITGDRTVKWVLEIGRPIYDGLGCVCALEGIIIDISELKARENEILYMNKHDQLTDLYTHQQFEKECRRMDREGVLPLSIVECDIDGLRIINDAFGHEEGDRLLSIVSKILCGCCGDRYTPFRMGGDDFCILMPFAGDKEAEALIDCITEQIDLKNHERKPHLYDISVTFGSGTRHTLHKSIDEAIIIASDDMLNRKILNRRSSRNAVLSSIMTTLRERSEETEEHARRLGELAKMMGLALDMPQRSLADLELFSMLHDIGKVGIDDRILKNPGPLNEEEWKAMKKHPEIGYRIAMSCAETKPVAENILSHHERWDGSGYPRGLKGEQIPLMARILALADAYDAMTQKRFYRVAVSRDNALAEIQKNAGTQFDPALAELFIRCILQS